MVLALSTFSYAHDWELAYSLKMFSRTLFCGLGAFQLQVQGCWLVVTVAPWSCKGADSRQPKHRLVCCSCSHLEHFWSCIKVTASVLELLASRRIDQVPNVHLTFTSNSPFSELDLSGVCTRLEFDMRAFAIKSSCGW